MELKGRHIDDVPFTGLVESLCAITLTCHVAGEAANDLTKDDLLGLMSQIVVKATEALAFAGATRTEIQNVTTSLMQGMQTRERPQ